jgi:redox-sensitive bicupin YhaK (pirin superfamily)
MRAAQINSTVEAVIPMTPIQRSAGLRIAQLHERVLGASLDPFLACDCFWMAQPFFPPHPHAGMSAVTYMLPESVGSFVNRDSHGDRSFIHPGSLHWTEAARGIMHEEVPIEPGVECQGLQIFVNLHSSQKLADARSYHLAADEVPVLTYKGASMRVLVGKQNDVISRVQPRTECALWDISLEPNATLVLPLPKGWNAFGVLNQGSLAGFSVSGLAAVRFRANSSELVIIAASEPVRLVLFCGMPLNEPLVFGGPFVMNTLVELEDAKRRFIAGDMGHLSPSFN